MDLFENVYTTQKQRPLADRMRPGSLDEFSGQERLLGPEKVLRKSIEGGRLFSMLFWGPPGVGKTTLAQIIAKRSGSKFHSFSAVTVGVKEIREVASKAREDLKFSGVRTILFLDEIHRFNKAQQDYLLPHVENGDLILIGATTENPSFEVNSALLSRMRVFILEPLVKEDIEAIIDRALLDRERGLGKMGLVIKSDAKDLLVSLGGGDARYTLNILDAAANLTEMNGQKEIDLGTVQEAAQKRGLLYDKAGEEHYNLISALHKSLRDSDPDAGLYWMGRMIEAGEDPLYIARRLVRFASEDVGLAAPQALEQAVAAYQACRFVGLPECALALAQIVVYLAMAPKSNSLEVAYLDVKAEIGKTGSLPPPLHIRNAPTKFMKQIGYGKGYKYAHDYPGAVVEQEHMPDELRGRRFYIPTDRGFEKNLKERLDAKSKTED
ncbi:MAG: replication-associated recombination protein A [Deltaproteobacteria bacterium]|nr:replication-associated recombination protein A [Deltaproteobacteria bacterium]